MCAASGGSSTWGNAWERAYALVALNERATMKDNCFTKRNSMDIIPIGSFASEVEICAATRLLGGYKMKCGTLAHPPDETIRGWAKVRPFPFVSGILKVLSLMA